MVAMSQGDLYKHYASRTDIAVAQVSGFKLNDSVRVDVVLLVADNSAAWKRSSPYFWRAMNLKPC